MSRKRSALDEIDLLLDELVKAKAISARARDRVCPAGSSKVTRRNLSDRALRRLRSLDGEASAALGTDPSTTELIRWVHRRLGAESARALEAGSLSGRPKERATKRQAFEPEDLAIVRSYLGEASDAFGRHVAISEAVEYMVECLLAKRTGRVSGEREV